MKAELVLKNGKKYVLNNKNFEYRVIILNDIKVNAGKQYKHGFEQVGIINFAELVIRYDKKLNRKNCFEIKDLKDIIAYNIEDGYIRIPIKQVKEKNIIFDDKEKIINITIGEWDVNLDKKVKMGVVGEDMFVAIKK